MKTPLNPPSFVPVSFVKAAAIILVAIMLYDIMGAIIKHLGQQYPAPQLSMFRGLFGLIPTLGFLFWSKTWVNAGRPLVLRQWKLALARGGIGAFLIVGGGLVVIWREQSLKKSQQTK